MRTIFIDENYKCHVEYTDGMRAIETDFFDGKCSKYIEGFRFIPFGEEWTREDGEVFYGKMVSPWRDLTLLIELQSQYEEMLAQQEDMRSALDILGVTE